MSADNATPIRPNEQVERQRAFWLRCAREYQGASVELSQAGDLELARAVANDARRMLRIANSINPGATARRLDGTFGS
jgi:hypothetical protein